MHKLALLVLATLGIVSAEEKPCTLRSGGIYYNLNPLKSTSKDYEFRTREDHLFVLNICRGPVRETFGMNDVDNPDIGGFVRRDHGDFSIGALNTTVTVQDSRPRITMANGSRCRSKMGNNQLRASTVIEFICDSSVSGNGMPRLVAQLPPGDDDDACAFFFEWRSGFACPTSEPGTFWSFLWSSILTLIALALLYLAAGTIYNRYVLHLRGVDQIPKFSSESMKYHAREALNLLMDLAGSMRSGGAYNRTSASSYRSGLPTQRTTISPSVNPVSHQSLISSPGVDCPTHSNGSGFVTPQRAAAMGRMNPVSHQAQVPSQQVGTPPSSSAHGHPNPTVPPEKTPELIPTADLGELEEEFEFKVGEDEDEGEGENMPLVPDSTNGVGATSSSSSGTGDGNSAGNAIGKGRVICL